MLGWTQQEISDKLQELWPDSKGISRQSVQDILPENGNDRFLASILSQLATGMPLAKVAQRNGWTQQEISDQLQVLFPDAKGTSRVSVTESLSELSKTTFPTISKDLADAPPRSARGYRASVHSDRDGPDQTI